MPRLRSLAREDLAPEHRYVYDNIAADRGGVPPNYTVLLNSPLAASRLAALGAYIRFETLLPARIKALALLTAAREAEGDYVWTANQTQARSAGLTEDIIHAIREQHVPASLAPDDASIVRFTLELLKQHRISDATFRAVQQQVGDAGVVDLLILIGYYSGLAHALAALEVQPLTPSTLSSAGGTGGEL